MTATYCIQITEEERLTIAAGVNLLMEKLAQASLVVEGVTPPIVTIPAPEELVGAHD